jgi:predicted adenine nucleotide alpha hydrolase (AANH) superfamily ATPase
MKLLMHICCSNCCLYPIKELTNKGIDIKGLWINPNIHPFTEYRLRLESLKQLENLWNLDIEYIDNYGLKEFLRKTVYKEDERCYFCYTMRLNETAKIAKKMGLDGFTTSLLVSPYQKHDLLITVGNEISKIHSVRFYYEDFRKGWFEGINISKKLGLYRQKYCGCIYSEMERYLKKQE